MKQANEHLNILNDALAASRKKQTGTISKTQIGYVKCLVDNAEAQKSLIAVTITSLIEKIRNPAQDVRLHRSEFKGGYSGRSLDTRIITPFLKKHFPRFAPKESGWLTRSIEQPHPFTMNFPGKIRNEAVKKAFLAILNDVEEKKQPSRVYLEIILAELLKKCGKESKIAANTKNAIVADILKIDIIIEMLEKHFSLKQSSRLPVIAIYTIYQLLLENVKIYQSKTLNALRSHTTSDRYVGYADIEIFETISKTPFEVVEVKHNIPIDCQMIQDVLKKIKDAPIKRYFVLTTANPNFKDSKKKIFDLVHKIKAERNIDVVPNGIIPSLKYYLRLVPDLKDFLAKYTFNISEEFKSGSDVKKLHISEWMKIVGNL
ncbi:MAG TPA: hypothetical protein DCP47_06030 [Phycisphaerales bacterium]|nr:hypothetical protein [Phycisphaerales bacterium]